MPVIYSLDKTMKKRIDDFYGNASVFRPNKFLVGFYGEYVRQAIQKLRSDAEVERFSNNLYNGNQKESLGDKVYLRALNRWLKKHYNHKQEQIELKWTCTDVELPSVQTQVHNSYLVDSVTSIRHPLLISGTNDLQQVKIGIMEDRNMMVYQFFNALLNRFFTPQILKPRSSFHKLGMYVAVLQEDFVIPRGSDGTGNPRERGMLETGVPRDMDLDAIVSQVFEFNSIVMSGMPTLDFNNKIDKPLTYNLSFYTPNTFQGSFKTSFKGLRNNTSDKQFLSGVDSNGMDKTGQYYNRNNFEISTNRLKTNANGVYEKTLEPE